jgi:hypothetical protein
MHVEAPSCRRGVSCQVAISGLADDRASISNLLPPASALSTATWYIISNTWLPAPASDFVCVSIPPTSDGNFLIMSH